MEKMFEFAVGLITLARLRLLGVIARIFIPGKTRADFLSGMLEAADLGRIYIVEVRRVGTKITVRHLGRPGEGHSGMPHHRAIAGAFRGVGGHDDDVLIITFEKEG